MTCGFLFTICLASLFQNLDDTPNTSANRNTIFLIRFIGDPLRIKTFCFDILLAVFNMYLVLKFDYVGMINKEVIEVYEKEYLNEGYLELEILMFLLVYFAILKRMTYGKYIIYSCDYD